MLDAKNVLDLEGLNLLARELLKEPWNGWLVKWHTRAESYHTIYECALGSYLARDAVQACIGMVLASSINWYNYWLLK